MKLFLAGLALVTLPGCVTAEAERELPGCTSMKCVAMGEPQQAGLIAGDLVVTPLEVLEDSRCPIEAECIWAGRVRLKVELSMGHETIVTELTTERSTRVHGGMLAIGEVAPEASGQWMPLEQGDYRFGFTFAPDLMQAAPPAS